MSAQDENLNLKYTLDSSSVEAGALAMAKAMGMADKSAQAAAAGVKALHKSIVENTVAQQKATSVQQQVINTMRKGTEAANVQKDTITTLTLSWKSFERYLIASMARRAIYGLISSMREGLDEAVELNKRIAEIQTISQDRPLPFDTWAEGLRKVSDAIGLDIIDTAESAYQALSNQVVKGAEAFKFMSQSSIFAITTVSNQADAVNLLSSALNSFELNVKDTEAVAASFFKTIELGRVRAGEMANSFGRISVLSNQLNIDLDELNTVLATSTIKGLKFNEAATQVRGIMTALVKPTKAMKELFREIGVESGEAAIAAYGLAGFIKQMANSTAGQSQEIAKLIPRIRGMSVAMALTADGGEEYAKTLEQIRNAQESYMKATEIAMQSSGREIDRNLTRIKNYFIKDLGLQAVEAIAYFTKNIIELDQVVKTTVETFRALAIAIVAVTAAQQGYYLVTLRLAAVNPYLAAIVAVTTLIGYISYLRSEEAKALREIEERNQKEADAFNRRINDQTKLFKEYNNNITQATKNTNAEIRADWFRTIDDYSNKIKEINKTLDKSFKNIAKAFSDAIKEVDDSIKDAENRAKSLLTSSENLITKIREDIFRETLKDLVPREQIEAISKEIEKVSQDRIKAEKEGATELAQDLLAKEYELRKERVELDRKRVEETKKLSKEQVDLYKKTELELDEYKKKLAKAEKEKDKEDIAKTKSDIRKLHDEVSEELRQISFERSKLEDETLGKFVNNYKTEFEKVIEIQKQQRNALFLKELEEIDRLTEYRKAKAAELAVFEENLKRFKEFDIKAEIGKAQTPEQLDQIIAERAKSISDILKIVDKVTDEQTRVTVRQQLEQLGAYEQKIKDLELEKQKLNLLENQLDENNKIKNETRERIQDEIIALNEQKRIIKENAELLLKSGELGKTFTKTYFDTLSGTGLQKHAEIFMYLKDFEKLLASAKRGDLDTNEASRLAKYLGDIFAQLPKDSKTYADSLLTVFAKNLDILAVAQRQLEILKERNKAEEEIRRTVEKYQNIEVNKQQSLNNLQAKMNELLKQELSIHRQIAEIQQKAIQTPTEVETHAAGGMAGYGSDTVPALLTPGEFVLNANATRKFYSQLIAMNSAPKAVYPMSNGGQVSVGDINVTMQSSGNENYDIQKLARGLQRGIRRGTVKLQ